MQDLGTFPGAFATFIGCCNRLNKGAAHGRYRGHVGEHARHSMPRQLPGGYLHLIPADSQLYLTVGSSMDDSGQIVGNAIVKNSCPPANPPNWQVNQSSRIEVHAFWQRQRTANPRTTISFASPTPLIGFKFSQFSIKEALVERPLQPGRDRACQPRSTIHQRPAAECA
jgi:hypothetical protein